MNYKLIDMKVFGDERGHLISLEKGVNSIKIYTENFGNKEAILDYLDEWNDTHLKEDQVRYTDTVGMMMTMMQTML